jgi:hypothetical protein
MKPHWLKLAERKIQHDVSTGAYKARNVTADSFFHWRAWCASTGHFMPITEVRISHKRAPRIETHTATAC